MDVLHGTVPVLALLALNFLILTVGTGTSVKVGTGTVPTVSAPVPYLPSRVKIGTGTVSQVPTYLPTAGRYRICGMYIVHPLGTGT